MNTDINQFMSVIVPWFDSERHQLEFWVIELPSIAILPSLKLTQQNSAHYLFHLRTFHASPDLYRSLLLEAKESLELPEQIVAKMRLFGTTKLLIIFYSWLETQEQEFKGRELKGKITTLKPIIVPVYNEQQHSIEFWGLRLPSAAFWSILSEKMETSFPAMSFDSLRPARKQYRSLIWFAGRYLNIPRPRFRDLMGRDNNGEKIEQPRDPNSENSRKRKLGLNAGRKRGW